jgi:pimeloyl-ACP methyl ester carboxylesterase
VTGEPSPPIVLLHPLGSSRAFWGPLREQWRKAGLGDGLLALDLPGHGGAELPPTSPVVADYSEAVLDELDRAGLATADLVGVSLGGLVAQHLAVHHPDRVRRLVLAGTVAVYAPATKTMWLARAEQARREGLAALVRPTARLWFSEVFETHPDAQRALAGLSETNTEGYARACEMLAEVDLRAEVGSIRTPTLVVCGQNDGVEFRQAARDFARWIPSARLVTLPGQHAVAIENACDFATALAAFLVGAR